ncbi:hypothetical protein, partial [uncultured Alistipes sp.]|uniref:hypothetical protein n=1 Tax=uncultured Alistipes sp. TaxID=538949 RepID=UPI00266FA9D1
ETAGQRTARPADAFAPRRVAFITSKQTRAPPKEAIQLFSARAEIVESRKAREKPRLRAKIRRPPA